MRKNILRISFFTAALCVVYYSKTNVSGPGAGYTSAPSESTCNKSGCHTGSSLQTSGTKWDKISLTGNFTGNGYIPDSVYTLYLTYKESGITRTGYQITALDATNSPAGTFDTYDSRTQVMSATVGGKNRSYTGHTSSGVGTVTTDSFAWKIKWTAPNKNVGKISFYINFNVTNANSNESGDIIYAKQAVVSPSTLLPTAKIKIQDSVNCSGVALTFDAVKTGNPTSYVWNFPGTGVSPSSSTSATPKVTYSFTGTYKAYLTTKSSKGTGSPDTLTFTVVQGATTPTISPSGLSNLCKGDSALLTVTTPANGHTYAWTNGGTTRSIKVADSGIYSVTVKNANKCFKTATTAAQIRLLEKPTIKILHSFSGDTVCANTKFTMGALVMTGTVDSYSYVSAFGPWHKKDTLQDILTGGSKTYSVWGKSPAGCVSPASVVTVFTSTKSAAPVITSDSIDYTGFKINWTANPKAKSYLVSTDSGKTFITPSSGSTGLYHHITGLLGNHTMNVLVYAVTNDLCGVSNVGNITVTTLKCATIPFTVTTNKTRACKGSDVTITINGWKDKKIAVQIDGSNVGKDTIQKIKLAGTHTYSIGVLDSAALICGYSTQTIKITEDTINTPFWNLKSVEKICSNAATENFTVLVSNNGTFDTLQYWQNNAVVQYGKVFTHTFNVKNNDSIWLIAKNKNGCFSEATSKTKIAIDSIPNADFDISNTHFDYTFTPKDARGNHKWQIAGDSFTTQVVNTDLTSSAKKTILISHTVTLNGCVKVSSVSLTVPDFAQIKVPGIGLARLYPNPAGSEFTLEVQGITESATFYLVNNVGQVMLQRGVINGINKFNTGNFAPGIYTYKIATVSGTTSGNLIIDK